MAQRLDSPAAMAVRGEPERRISASSFRLLTAKLKKAPVPEFAPVKEAASEAAAAEPETAAAEPVAEAVSEAALASFPDTLEIAAPPVAVHAVALPEFQPIAFLAPVSEEPELQLPEILPLDAEHASGDAPLEEIAAPEPEPEPEPEIAAVAALEPEPAAPAGISIPPFPEFAFEPLLEAETGESEPVVVEEPVVEDAVSEEPPAAEEAAAAAPEETAVLESLPAEPAIEEPAPVEPEPASPTAALEAEPAEPEAALPDAGADELRQDENEPKAALSPLADRVVDAMLKTISTAIYAKPSASERAAFLREIAVLMEQEPVEAPAATEPVIAMVQAPPVIQDAPAAPPAGDAPMSETLASRIGPTAALLKPKAETPDPFAQNISVSRLADPKLTETFDADEASGELALTLLDMMSGGNGTALPHERTLAADTLLRILPRIPVKQLLAVVERATIMENPPALLVAKLIRDPRPEVVGPLLERCSHISDQDLMNAAPDGDAPKLRMIARRRILSTVLSDYLIASSDPGVLLTLIRNPGAAIAHDAFYRLAERATHHHGLLAPLATRADLPPPVAFELFWHVPQELRRFIFSRFLTDSETLNKILRITLSTHGDAGNDVAGDGKFPSRESIEAAVALASEFKLEEAARQFAEIGGISKDTALRILSDREGEPITVLFKALGYPRSKFEEALARLRHADSGVLRPDRNPEEMQAIFDGLSFNKARILLTYWDWYVRKAGPYSPHN